MATPDELAELDRLYAASQAAKEAWEAARKAWRQAAPADKAAARKREQDAAKAMSRAAGAWVNRKKDLGLWPTYSFLDRHATDKAA